MQKKIIIGYSIDAVLEAISILTQSDKTEVVFYATGPLGSPLDNFNDYISNNDIMLLLQFLPKLKYSYIYSTIYPLNFSSARISDLIRPLKANARYGYFLTIYI